MKQVILVFICATIAAICFGSKEIPKECQFGSPEYNEALCNETCTKTEHVEQPYCANFTHPDTPKPNVPPTPAHEEVEKEEAKKEETKTTDHPHEEHKDEHTKSFALSIRPSIMFGASTLLLSFCL